MAELFKRTHLCGTLTIADVDKEVVLNGWVAKQRSLGGLIFADLRDKTPCAANMLSALKES